MIEFMNKDDLDGSGWGLRKTVKLSAKSNAPLIEWLYSTVVYCQDDDFLEQMRLLAKDCFSPIACLYHYLGRTKNFMDICNAEEVKLKSYFYALRTALAGKWIIERNTFPPVAFAELLSIAPLPIQGKILQLQAIKVNQDEKYLHTKEVLITEFSMETIKFNEEGVKGLGSGKKMAEELDGVFRKQLS